MAGPFSLTARRLDVGFDEFYSMLFSGSFAGAGEK
jgi:hypothetical protein